MERKLTAILSVDVHGYSRLMGTDEEGTLRTLTAYRQIIDTLIARHHGRIVGTAGDSVLAEFASQRFPFKEPAQAERYLGALRKAGLK